MRSPRLLQHPERAPARPAVSTARRPWEGEAYDGTHADGCAADRRPGRLARCQDLRAHVCQRLDHEPGQYAGLRPYHGHYPLLLFILSGVALLLQPFVQANLDTVVEAIRAALSRSVRGVIAVEELLNGPVGITGPLAIRSLIALVWPGSSLFVNVEAASSAHGHLMVAAYTFVVKFGSDRVRWYHGHTDATARRRGPRPRSARCPRRPRRGAAGVGRRNRGGPGGHTRRRGRGAPGDGPLLDPPQRCDDHRRQRAVGASGRPRAGAQAAREAGVPRGTTTAGLVLRPSPSASARRSPSTT